MDFTLTVQGNHHTAADFFAGLGAQVAQQAPAVITRRAIPRIGEHWEEQGGHNMGWFKGVNGPDYILIAPGTRAERSELEWGSYGEEEPGAQCEFDGLRNTQSLLASKHAHPFVAWINDFELDGHRDFYVPSRREERQCWINGDTLFDKNAWYWTSTQYSRYDAWSQDFNTGRQGTGGKYDKFKVALVRRFVPSIL